jgi:hypothetical protein
MAGFQTSSDVAVRTSGAGGLGNSLGVFTWANLQAAYPNGGGALAALPAGVTATVTDAAQLPLTMTPNAAKTRWIPLNGVAVLWQYGGSYSSPLWTQAGATGQWSPPGGAMTNPAGLFAAGDSWAVDWNASNTGTAANIFYKLNFGTAGTTADAAVVDVYQNPSNPSYYTKVDVSAGSSNRLVSTQWAPPINNAQAAGYIADATANVNLASAMTWTWNVVSINAADTFLLIRSTIVWRASA